MIRTIKFILLSLTALTATEAFAQTPDVKTTDSLVSNPLFLAMGILSTVLLLVIAILSAVLRTAVKTKIREILSGKGIQTILAIFWLLSASTAYAQDQASKTSLYEAEPIAGMHPMGFYALFTILLIELFVILWLCLMILRIIVKKEADVAETTDRKIKKPAFLSEFVTRKLLGVKPVESDKDVMLDHDYDGIKELDNDLPPWWKYGFYLTIISGIVYLFSYHVTHTSKSSLEEYNEEMANAEASVNAYRIKMALNVDETNAVFVTEPEKIEKGKAIFTKNCVVCHGNAGQGLVGPNFTDKNWLYGNKPGDLFRTVKNGTNKGMKAWKDELTPVDMQNVIGFIHTLQGTNPPNPKAPEGELYDDAAKAITGNTNSIDSAKNIEIKP